MFLHLLSPQPPIHTLQILPMKNTYKNAR
uniref:Uncharacterized protein n=1 Tax=Arundo donax TaxID=35708 RepID=A0A0A8ZGW2_ARUDO